MVYIAVQSILFYLMLLIGLNLTMKDLRRIKRHPYLVVGITVAQIVMLPLLAYLLILLFKPQESIAIGMMLVAICPSGALSNFYSLMAKGDAALSLTLTAVSSFVSVFVLPIILIFFYSQFSVSSSQLSSVVVTQAVQLSLTLLLPVVMGIFIRNKFEIKLIPRLAQLERCGFIGLLLLIAGILVNNFAAIGEQLLLLIILSSTFTLLAMLLASCLCRFAKLTITMSLSILFEFPVRNLAVATFVAVNVFARADYLLFAALFLVIQTPFMLLSVWWGRRWVSLA
ncbi:bile acid:sodium symporter family protein [Shewanella sp. 125m-7]